MKSHGPEGSSSCPIACMDVLYELSIEAHKVFTLLTDNTTNVMPSTYV